MVSIYVSVPSIRDSEFIKTIHRCLENSSGGNVINVGATGIFYDHEYENIKEFLDYCIYNNNITFQMIDRSMNSGTGVARRKAIELYDGEDYYFQIDSHSIFKKNWDISLIDKLNYLKNNLNYEKVALSAYPPEYKYIDNDTIICQNGWSRQSVSSFTDGNLISKTNHGIGCLSCEQWSALPLWEEVNVTCDKNIIVPNTKISAGYLFADKMFAENYNKLVKWDYAFLEEELIMSIEAHDLGWRFYTISGDVDVAHLYAEDLNEYSGSRSYLTEDDILKLNVKQNYLNYTLDPKNRDKIEKFEKHANVKIIELAESESRKVENRTAILSQRLDEREGS